jgi:hypothetical protein
MNLKGATGVAAVAAIGNLLQGWDGGAIAGKNISTICPLHLPNPNLFFQAYAIKM